MPDSRAIIVTGASSGIGRALAIAAAREGFAVLIVARRAERLDEVARQIRAAGGRCETLVADVRAPDSPQRIVEAATRAFARIDVVVNNAGSGVHGTLLAQSDAAIEAQWQLHVAAPLRIARAALSQLERVHGQLVFIGSGVSRVPLPEYGAYPLAKAAVRAAAIQLRRELREHGVAVTYVDPGLVATEFHGAMGIRRSRVKATKPQRVAGAILRGIRRRTAVVNAVPWQTAGTVAGELLASLADPLIARMRPQRMQVILSPSTSPAAQAPLRTGSAPEGHVIPSPSTTPATQATLRTGSAPEGRAVEGPVLQSAPQPAPSFEAALEPVARRMERVKLSPTFVREALVLGTTLELNEVAMRWAGMPNKNERAALREVFDALTASGYLEPIQEETWKVVRAPE
jgi:short-subunit dehydrogenase